MLMMANSAPWDGQWILLAPGIVILVGDSGLELVQPNGGGRFYYPDNYSTSSLKQPQSSASCLTSYTGCSSDLACLS